MEKKGGRPPSPNSSAHLYRTETEAAEESKPRAPLQHKRKKRAPSEADSTPQAPPAPASISPDDPLFTAAAHILAAHWARALEPGGGGRDFSAQRYVQSPQHAGD